MEDAIYGGRIDNPYDARVLRAYLRKFFSQDVIEGRCPLSGNLSVPIPCSYEAAVSAISKFSDHDTPELFGLPMNIERSIQRAASIQVADKLRKLNVTDGESTKFDREVWRSKLVPLLEHWEKLTKDCPIDVKKNLKSDLLDRNDPISGFVFMEHEASLTVVNLVSSCLATLKKILYGTTLLTPHIQEVAASLLKGAIPASWARQWNGPEKPNTWFSLLVRKSLGIKSWRSKVLDNSLLKEELDLNDVFRPLTFLNALCQLTARQAQCPMDGLQLVSAWSAASIDSPSSISIKNLRLQGAELQGTYLIEARSNAPETTQMPPLALGYSKLTPVTKSGSLKVPCYHSATREQFLVEIALPIREDADKWILAGVALLLTEIQ
mmetsp:Transcript_32467/g.100483  ORF Transcript_32467/g.100483 Transcript_32467/m.100483 type:complete len:380 (+) Transcript_32467:1-1140(+)